MPVLLDTDHLSVLQWQEQPACDRLLARLDRLPVDDVATSIVSFQEQVQGWQAYLNRAKKPNQIVEAYAKPLKCAPGAGPVVLPLLGQVRSGYHASSASVVLG